MTIKVGCRGTLLHVELCGGVNFQNWDGVKVSVPLPKKIFSVREAWAVCGSRRASVLTPESLQALAAYDPGLDGHSRGSGTRG